MGELRWILLLAGLVFLAALAAWEMRRSRQGRRERSGSSLPEPPPSSLPGARGEPELGHLPEEFVSGARAAGAGPSLGRTPGANPPIVQLPPLEESSEIEPFAEAAPQAQAAPEPDAQGATQEVVGQAMPMTEAAPAPAPAPAAAAAGAPSIAPLRVDWPPEGARQIIALRLTAASEQRLSGRTARQALAACGFEHGRYGIFHQPSVDGRSLLSCASLSKPGIFDPAAMDFQRFAGLSVFMVLPGPLPAQEALERLLETGMDLAQRLQAHLQDEQGHLLDAATIQALRDDVREFSATVNACRPTEPAA